MRLNEGWVCFARSWTGKVASSICIQTAYMYISPSSVLHKSSLEANVLAREDANSRSKSSKLHVAMAHNYKKTRLHSTLS